MNTVGQPPNTLQLNPLNAPRPRNVFVDDIRGKVLCPFPLYIPVRQAGFELLQDDMLEVHEHLKTISTLSIDEAAQSNRVKTAEMAQEVFELMEEIEELRSIYSKGWTTSDHDTFDEALLSLGSARAEYYVLLPLTFRINDLPPELLTRIFRLSLWPLMETDADLWGAIHLSHVCRFWRSVAISDQRLWNPVCFPDPAKYDRAFEIMERAGPSGLEVRIRDRQANPMSKETMKNLINRIFPWVHGIRKLDIFTFTREAMDPVLEALAGISQLESPVSMDFLELHCFLATSPPNTSYVGQPSFGGAIPPFFKHLCLDGVAIAWQFGLLSRLTTLDLRRISIETLPSSSKFRAILQNATGLEKLVLDAAGPTHPSDIPPRTPPVVVPTVKVLVIGGCTDSYFEYLLSHFTVPNVLDLTISFPMSSFSPKLLITLATSHRMPLVQIVTVAKFPRRDRPFAPDQEVLTAKWLATMPDLTFLRVIDTTPSLFDVLAFDQNTFTFAGGDDWPKDRPKKLLCQQLKYLDWQTSLEDLLILRRSLASRKLLGCPLQRLWIAPFLADRMSPEETEMFATCLAERGIVAVSDMRTDEEDRMCPPVTRFSRMIYHGK